MAIEFDNAVRRQYERWPYPAVPLWASVPSTHPWQLGVDWLWDRCGSGSAPDRPRIWIAGCGTFQPYVFAQANPRAEILATDLSRKSLAIARRRCRLRGMRSVDFAEVDLTSADALPQGPFDLIECYGVLMNLPDPAAALRRMADRLTPGGLVRIMVYPHYSRQRIFQIQRLAKLLGLNAGEHDHPRLLRRLMRALPRNHPLRHAFVGYPESRNDAGVVDAFLHAGDRGFTGFQLGELVRNAGLRPALFFHRPWGQPERMAEKLGLRNRGWDVVLNYLDLWQELRGNFVVCLVPDRQRSVSPPAETAHPLLTGEDGGLRHRLRLLRGRIMGARLPDRMGDRDLRLTAADFRALAQAGRARPIPEAVREKLRRSGVLLGSGAAVGEQGIGTGFAREADFLAFRPELSRRAANPLYRHLFQAWSLAALHPELDLPDLETQVGRWLPHADPLEDEAIRFGLTPYGTYLRFRTNVQEWLERLPQVERTTSWGEVRLRDEDGALGRVRAFLDRFPHLRGARPSAAEMRELWCLLFSHRELFVPLARA